MSHLDVQGVNPFWIHHIHRFNFFLRLSLHAAFHMHSTSRQDMALMLLAIFRKGKAEINLVFQLVSQLEYLLSSQRIVRRHLQLQKTHSRQTPYSHTPSRTKDKMATWSHDITANVRLFRTSCLTAATHMHGVRDGMYRHRLWCAFLTSRVSTVMVMLFIGWQAILLSTLMLSCPCMLTH